MVRLKDFICFLCLLPLLISGCGQNGSTQGFRPINSKVAIFWDRQTTETAQLLQEIASEFNANWDGIPLKVVRSGTYTDIYRKVTVSIQAGALPSIAVAYESMVPEYVRAGAILPLEDFLRDPERGISQEDLDDFFPAVLATNRFDEFGGTLYSFPYTKSVLMLYFNKRVMAEGGFDRPPSTWDEFLEQCRGIKEKTGKRPLSVDVDASTVNGLIFSMGGEVYSNGVTLYDSPESVRFFELLEVLVREGLASQNPPRTFNDETAFGRDEIAFTFRTSSTRPHIADVMDDPGAWGMVRVPQADPEDPHTVLYGANVCIFDTTQEQKEAGWAFAKFFTSREISVRWALGTGYIPVRKSAAESTAMQEFWAQWPYNRAAFDCMPFAKPEPNIAGWQEVRGLIERAETAVLTGVSTGRQAAMDLKRDADAVLKARREADSR